MNCKEVDINKLENDLLSEDSDYDKFHQLWEPLSKFIIDYEHLRGLNKLTQNEIAIMAKTTQSAISRLVRMKGKPTYALLNKVSMAVGGKLFVTPLAEMTVTLPFDLHSHAIKLAEAQEISVSELMLNFLRESFNNHQVYKPQDDCFETNAVEQFDDLLYKSQEKCLGNFEKAESASPENDFLDNATNGLHNSEYGLAV